ncbi:MAG: EAL domain-containing protein [Proteobacteria bacterium]|nr:EAL domain-containing protein [Pseudomonadota bacterium]
MIQDARILVVDDIASNRFILITHLKKQGFSNIIQAENGRQALDLLQKDRFDIVLLDVMMPEVDGFEVLEKMKADENLRNIPVIMITALDDMDSTVKCIESGAEDYLLKPFNAVLLQARVKACLEKKHLRDVEREYLRLYDSATGLPNRDLFLNRLADELRRWHRHPSLFSVILIRLGRYQMIIDGLGQKAGDAFLDAQGRRLKNLLPFSALLARLGHNEFAVIFNDLDHAADGNAWAQKIHQNLEQSLQIMDHEISGSIQIGLAYSPTGYKSPEDMLRDAGLAANQVGQKSGFQIFDVVMHKQAIKRLELESELKLALAQGQFLLYYQPIVTIDTGKIIGFEALVRWRHPEKGMVSPDDFIPLAEETGLIVPMGTWILEEACRQAAIWIAKLGDKHRMTMGVNVSAHQFSEINFMDTVKNALNKAQLHGSRLKLELTETALIDKPERIKQVLDEVRELNIKTALDDFGTGYCSLSYLHLFPFDTLKIDQVFVRHIDTQPKNREIVHSTITLAHRLGMDVIAEGIETEKEAESLRSMGCEFGQGMLFESPLPAENAEKLLFKNL